MNDHHGSSAMEDEYRDWDASYVLGALPADQRLEYEQHLSGCAACRAAVAELAGLPGIVGRLSVEDALAISASDDGEEAPPSVVTLPAIAHRVRTRRRRRRLVTSLAVAAAVTASVLGGVALGTGIAGAPVASEATLEPMDPIAADPALAADIQVEGKPWGTRLEWSCTYSGDAPADAEYELVITRTDGSTITVATWTAAGQRAVDLAASTGIARSEITVVDIRVRGTNTPLVRTDT
ncbi:zf-HC2 domain-containing protein [Rathayibacter sp. VKM Ac-2801]|uniref:anti-sigma factor family protein n=1 Tax=Rathayibacter sp. VKM Ac-2801 TaxID=2609255 RepID=UPI00131F88A0|nr:zf-HC2 domain-containing protein [Rathayibacter sp. VKM Ac-2801]QHC72182.1 hypothetical protein GSU45_16745 [Rathayibacter sp. VKM Ac-2801]